MQAFRQRPGSCNLSATNVCYRSNSGYFESAVTDSVRLGGRVLIYDWVADWAGLGLAEKLASEGNAVALAVNGVCTGLCAPSARGLGVAKISTSAVCPAKDV